MIKIFLTGATGFVGCEFLRYIKKTPKFEVLSGVRNLGKENHNSRQVAIGNLESCENKSLITILSGIDVVVHLAARAHIPLQNANNDLTELNLSRTNI